MSSRGRVLWFQKEIVKISPCFPNSMTSVNTNKVTGFLSYCVQHNSRFKMFGPSRVKKAHKGGNGFTQIYLVMNAMATFMKVFW